MKITISPPDAYWNSQVSVDIGVEATQRLLDLFSQEDGDGFRQIGDYRVFDGIPADGWLVVMVPSLRVNMVGIGDLPRRDGDQTGAGIHMEVEVARPGLAGLDYTNPPTEIGLDETLALAATLRPLLRLAGVIH